MHSHAGAWERETLFDECYDRYKCDDHCHDGYGPSENQVTVVIGLFAWWFRLLLYGYFKHPLNHLFYKLFEHADLHYLLFSLRVLE